MFITDVKAGVTPSDKEIALMLRHTKKPVILVCNKCDRVGEVPADIYEFYDLGLGDPLGISAGKKLGIGEMLDEIYDNLGDISEDSEEDDRIKVAIIGKPNVGKSSLINKILGEERLIVSNIAGTTRDAIDTELNNKYGKYTFIDTAGIRRKNKIYEDIEEYSVVKAKNAIDRANVCMILIDAKEGVTEQDEKIAGLAHEAGKGVIIVINKWDLIEKDNYTLIVTKNKYIQNLHILNMRL